MDVPSSRCVSWERKKINNKRKKINNKRVSKKKNGINTQKGEIAKEGILFWSNNQNRRQKIIRKKKSKTKLNSTETHPRKLMRRMGQRRRKEGLAGEWKEAFSQAIIHPFIGIIMRRSLPLPAGVECCEDSSGKDCLDWRSWP